MSDWQCPEKTKFFQISPIAPPVFRSGIVNLLLFSVLAGIITISFVSIINTNSAFGEENREIKLIPIFTRWLDDSFKHVYAICSSDLVKGDIILATSDIAMKKSHVEVNTEINDCRTFEERIMAIEPSSVVIQIIKTEDKEKTIQKLETKIATLENIIQRLFLERDELLRKANFTDSELPLSEYVNQKLSRISDLIDYQERISKKIKLISSI